LVGLAAAFALAPARRRLATAALPPALAAGLAVWLVSRSRPLTRWDEPASAVHDGRLMVAAALAPAVPAALLAAGRTRGLLIASVAAAVLAVAVAPSAPARALVAVGAHGGAYTPGAPPPGTSPSARLFSTAGNSRREYWRVALVDFRHHPL